MYSVYKASITKAVHKYLFFPSKPNKNSKYGRFYLHAAIKTYNNCTCEWEAPCTFFHDEYHTSLALWKHRVNLLLQSFQKTLIFSYCVSLLF